MLSRVMWEAVQAPFPGMEIPADEDPERDRVVRHLLSLDPDGQRFAATLRRAIDIVLDGRNTGRHRWKQLHRLKSHEAWRRRRGPRTAQRGVLGSAG